MGEAHNPSTATEAGTGKEGFFSFEEAQIAFLRLLKNQQWVFLCKFKERERKVNEVLEMFLQKM